MHSVKVVLKIFKKILIDYTKKSNKNQSVSKEQIDAEIDKNQQRIQNAQQLMLDGQLEPSDYKEIKNRFERIVTELNNKKRDLSLLDFNLPEYMTVSLQIVENLPKYFARADLKAKQQLIGSICPEKLIFENNSYRTKRANEVLALICSAANSFSDSKKDWLPFLGANPIRCPGLDSNQHILPNAAT